MVHNRAVPGRAMRAQELLERLSRGPDLRVDDPELSCRLLQQYQDWFAPLRAELIDLQPQLRVRRWVERECLRAVREWPVHQPFLSPRDFALFTIPLSSLRCRVTTVQGREIIGDLYPKADMSIDLLTESHLFNLASDDVADVVCVDPRSRPEEIDRMRQRTLTHSFRCPRCRGIQFTSSRIYSPGPRYHCKNDSCRWTGQASECFTVPRRMHHV